MSQGAGFMARFRERGGWWVVAQMPLLLLAYLVPVWTGYTLPFAQHDAFMDVGLVLLVVGVVQTAVGLLTLGSALTPYPRPVEGSRLRDTGVYALVRHPIYSGLLFMAFGWSLVQHSGAGVAFDLLMFVFFDRKAAREEIWLAEKFPGYAAYRKRVKKLIPWVY
jgi:protein-S-isoprenylcysteine O-methyltransferase Ste14